MLLPWNATAMESYQQLMLLLISSNSYLAVGFFYFFFNSEDTRSHEHIKRFEWVYNC